MGTPRVWVSVDFTASPLSGGSPLVVQFYDRSSNGDIYIYDDDSSILIEDDTSEIATY
jgi:PKD repeat protein